MNSSASASKSTRMAELHAGKKERHATMAKRTKEAPAPLPPVVRIKVDPPKDTESAEMTLLADGCIQGGTNFPTTIGTSPFLPAMTTQNAAVKLQMPIAKDGG